MGTALTQKRPPNFILAKQFGQTANSSTYVHEIHAITTAIQKWRYYLLGKQFVIETD